MSFAPLAELIDGLPNLCGAEAQVEEVTLHDTPAQTVSVSELWGRPVILVFYPADWSPVCGGELALYNELLPEFQGFGASLLGISVDGCGSRKPRRPA